MLNERNLFQWQLAGLSVVFLVAIVVAAVSAL